MQRLLILFCFFFIINTPAITQTAGNFHIQQYTTDNGLPSNGIKGLQWDEQTGFLWIATEAGIVRFNGVDFRSYTKENMPSIASERMLFMTRNIAGAMYISDLPGNIFSIEQSKPALWQKAAPNINPYYGNYYLLPVSDTFFLSHTNVPNASRFSALTDKIAGISDTACLILYRASLFYQSINFNNPVLLPFENGNINSLFKINNRLFITNNKKETFIINLADKSFSPVSISDVSGRILNTATNNGKLFWETGMQNPVLIDGDEALLFTYKDNKITAIPVCKGIPSDALIRSVQYSSKNRTLFIGTDSKGIIILSEIRVETKKRNDVNSKNRNSYYSQLELPGERILTNEGDIIGNNTAFINTLPIKGKFSYNISLTNDTLLWYNQEYAKLRHNCLHQYNYKTGGTKIYEKIDWETIVAASGTDFYLANNNGIGILAADSMKFLYKYPEKAVGNITFDLQEISPGILAIATCGGLFRFNVNTHQLDTVFSKENICVRSVWKYKDYLFFGTYGSGFYIWKNGKIKSMPLDKNKYLLYTHCFIPDDNGYCWISTNRGLFKSSLAELIKVFDSNTSSVYYHYFGKKDGMDMTELNGGCNPCALRLKNKIISFPSMDGLLWVDPEKAIPVLPEGDIFIDEVTIDNEIKDLAFFSQKNLPAKTGEIIIRLAFSAWCNKENIYLEYQLNDTVSWKPVSLGNGSEIRFNNLRPGKYKLRIRKLNGFGFNNYTYKTIDFSITTPWTQQWWFYILCALAILGLAVLYSRFRTRQYKIRQRKLEEQVSEKTKELKEQNDILEKNNTIKTRLISIISHDIVTPLKFVTVAGKNLIEKRNLMSEELQQETILEMTNTSQELQLLSTNILNWIKYQNENRRMVKEIFNLSEIVDQVFGVLNSLANQKKLRLINEIQADLEIYQFFEPLKILIYNLLTNAINFSEKGKIIVAGEMEGNNIIIGVKDEGVGMTPEQIQNIMADQFIISSANIDKRKGNGLGYLIIKDLVKMMGASLEIISEKGSGTNVLIYIPVTNKSKKEM
jgi:signal transduction histidine kinase